MPWNVIRIGFTDHFQKLRGGLGSSHRSRVFQYAPDDRRLFYEGNNLHLSITLRTLQCAHRESKTGKELFNALYVSNPDLDLAVMTANLSTVLITPYQEA